MAGLYLPPFPVSLLHPSAGQPKKSRLQGSYGFCTRIGKKCSLRSEPLRAAELSGIFFYLFRYRKILMCTALCSNRWLCNGGISSGATFISYWNREPVIGLCVGVGKPQSFRNFYTRSQNCDKATIGFVMSVCPNGTIRLPMDGFSWNFIFEDFSRICRENWFFIKIWPE
jgi:hypothetical protein